jgi:hypothetical protein
MVKMSVLADCLKKIVNAEKAGKRQVNILQTILNWINIDYNSWYFAIKISLSLWINHRDIFLTLCQ